MLKGEYMFSTLLGYLKGMSHSCVLLHTRGVYLKRRVFDRALLHTFRGGCLSDCTLLYTLKGGCLSYSTLLYYVTGTFRYSIVIRKGCLRWRQGCHYSTIQCKGVAPIILCSYTLYMGGSLFCPTWWRGASIKRMGVSLFFHIVWREGADPVLFCVTIRSYVLV